MPNRWWHGSRQGWLLLKGPSSESWFDPWVSHLQSLGVKFHFNSKLVKFEGTQNAINGAVVSVKDEEGGASLVTISADDYVMAITPFAGAEIVKSSDAGIRNDPELKKLSKLILDGPHIQISFRIGFREKISFKGYKHQAFIMRDSEFNLTLFPDDAIFPEDIDLGSNVKSLWTGTACCAFEPGELFGLTASQCTREGFMQEVLHQLFRSKSLDEMVAHANNGRGLKSFEIVHTEVWHSWMFPETANGYTHVTAPQPKWVTSCRTHPYQPECDTTIPNLKIAGSHTRTRADLWSMEGACESGRRAAFALDKQKKYRSQRGFVNRDTLVQRTPLAIRIFWKIDNALWACGLPNVADILIFLFFLLCLLVIVVTPIVLVK
jgi:hypothetical protein